MRSSETADLPRTSASSSALARPWLLAVWGAMLAWTAVLSLAARSDYLGFRYARFDLGNMTQAVWSTAHGRPLEMTLLSGEQSSRLASHVDPILALLAPAWLVWPSPLMLAYVQIVACAPGALPVFWLARKHLGSERTGAPMALAYLAYPWLAWTASDASSRPPSPPTRSGPSSPRSRSSRRRASPLSNQPDAASHPRLGVGTRLPARSYAKALLPSRF